MKKHLREKHPLWVSTRPKAIAPPPPQSLLWVMEMNGRRMRGKTNTRKQGSESAEQRNRGREIKEREKWLKSDGWQLQDKDRGKNKEVIGSRSKDAWK